MKLVKLIEFLRNRLKLLVRLSIGVLVLLVILDAIPAIVDKHHAHTKLEHLPGFWAVFGFIACALIIVLSKWFGHALVMKKEDYYDE